MFALPWARGANRHIALAVLVPLAAVALAIWAVQWFGRAEHRPHWSRWHALLVCFPLIAAVVQLMPLPWTLWKHLPERRAYADLMAALGTPEAWRPISLAPDATLDSLCVGLLLVLAFVFGATANRSQLTGVGRVVLGVATLQCLLALAQFASGAGSPLYFGAESYGIPVGSWANRNHLANYLCLSLILCAWLGWAESEQPQERRRASRRRPERLGRTARALLWGGLGVLFVLTVLLTRSRGALITGLSVALFGFAWVMRGALPWGRRGWLKVGLAVAVVLAIAVFMAGVELVAARLMGDQLSDAAKARASLTWTSLQGAWALFPFGSGWGTYGLVYPRYQPPGLPGQVDHAHNDYVELLFEGGLLGVALVLVLGVLIAKRIRALLRQLRGRGSSDESLRRTALFGLGLLGFAAHSLVEFNLHIPANAVLAAWMLGVFLRGHHPAGSSDDRSSLPHPARD